MQIKRQINQLEIVTKKKLMMMMMMMMMRGGQTGNTHQTKNEQTKMFQIDSFRYPLCALQNPHTSYVSK
jgi:hypothetical protein